MNGNGNYELLIIVMGIVVGSILGWDFVQKMGFMNGNNSEFKFYVEFVVGKILGLEVFV